MIRPSLHERGLALELGGREPIAKVVELRAGDGTAITAAARDELLKRVLAGDHVELELDVVAYEQTPDQKNRKSIRVRDGAMMAFARSGKGRPFLRDHEQGNSLARGGTIVESRAEKRGEGDYAILQKIRLAAPWATELALRGLMDSLSVGIHPGAGGVTCSVCGTGVFEQCFHFRGEEVEVDGEKVEVEWVYEAPELLETSSTPAPAEPRARINAIRAALSAATSNRGAEPHPHKDDMTNPKLLALLGLAATAGDPEVLQAVETVRSERDVAVAELGIARSELKLANAELGTFKADKKKADEDKFIADALSTGRIGAGNEQEWRALYALSSTRATELMAGRAAGSATPVGQPRQSGGANPPADPPANVLSGAEAVITQHGGNVNGVRKNLMSSGMSAKDADAVIARQLGGGKAV